MSSMNRPQAITDAWISPNKCASIALSTAKKETEALDMANIADSFAERLRSLRKQKNLSQTELGKLAGLHYTHIDRKVRAVALEGDTHSLGQALHGDSLLESVDLLVGDTGHGHLQ